MSLETTGKHLEIAHLGLRALEMVDKLAGRALGDESLATAALHAIVDIVTAIRAGSAGQLTAVEVEAELQKLHNQIAANDRSADSELDKKFPR
jgi:hypothetical protein